MSFWSALPRPLFGLSPMDGVTDACFRRLVAQQGKPDIVFTEFTHVHDVCRGPEALLETLIYSELERPVVAQLYGKDPDLFYQAVHAACELGFDGIDVNMGCPSKNVASSGSGAALIRTPDLAHAILRASRQGIADWADGQGLEQAGFKAARVAALQRLNARRGGQGAVPRKPIPLSIKTRLGFDCVRVEPWIEHLLQEQPTAITLHGRTLQQMYKGSADWSAIGRAAALAKGTGTLLLGNGDVQSLDDAVRRIRESSVDGVMVGRAVLGAPWFFHDKERARTAVLAAEGGFEGLHDIGPSLNRRFAVLLDHARQFESLYGRDQFHRMRKHLGWYCKGFPHAAALRARMFRVSSVDELQSVIAEYGASPMAPILPIDPVVDDLSTLVSRCSS